MAFAALLFTKLNTGEGNTLRTSIPNFTQIVNKYGQHKQKLIVKYSMTLIESIF
jgi:hypothetical protein